MHTDGLEGVVVAETRLSDVDGEHGRLAGVGPRHRPCRRRRARAGHSFRRRGVPQRQPRRHAKPQGPRHHRRRARGAPDVPANLRHHLLGAVEPLPGRHRQPLHPRVLRCHRGPAFGRRALPAMAPGLQRRRPSRAHHLRQHDERKGPPLHGGPLLCFRHDARPNAIAPPRFAGPWARFAPM